MANRRTQVNLPDGTKWRYGYDRLSQVTSGEHVDAQDAPVAGQSFRYAYDGIGNRTSSQDGSNADLRNYTANALNQYISIFSPGVIPIRGRADADARVAVTTTVGGVSTTYVPDRDGQGFSIDIPVDNSSGAVTAAVQVDALKHDGTLDLDLHRRLSGDYNTVPAATPEAPVYDLDANMLTCDGWTYAWNAEDRLVSATKGGVRLEFNYDYLGRRFEKKVYESNVLTKHQLFVYDGFKQLAEYDALNSNALTNTYLWQPVGLDVPLLRNCGEFYVSDANKNIVALIDTTGSVTDTYVYDPFGSCAHVGTSTNPFRFSSEYFDDETGLVYYNYRYYSPELGRWLSRDPSEERAGGLHLYGMCKNDSANVFDSLGLWLFWTHQNLTYNAFTYDLQLPYLLQTYFKHLIDLSALALKITSLVTNANVRTDFGEKKEKQQYHFCTNFADRNRMDFVALYTEALKAEMNDWDDLIVKKAFPTMENCMEALEHLGTLTHMWQDYYGHGVEYDPYLHPDDSPKRDFSIGEIKGNPDNIAMQPVTYGGGGFLGKHGGLFDIPSIEPGYRADDPDNRLKLARRFTYQKIAKMMPDWITKCHCLIRHWAN